MAILKEQHETFANFFAQPTREALRDLLRKNIGETDYLDFKSAWPDIAKLSKHILALANSGGGALVVGVTQESNGRLVPSGLPSIKDKASLIPPLGAYLPKTLEYQVLDFSFTASEYEALMGKSFQVLLVEDEPKHLPFLALKDAHGVRANAVYVRSGTSSAEASQLELQNVINRRIETGHSSQPALDLEKHLGQLKSLDELRPQNDCWLNLYFKDHMNQIEDRESSDFKGFVEEAYEMKKAQILSLLGLQF
ncbi:MAG: ATP-binding protein [Rhodanobacter sp.]